MTRYELGGRGSNPGGGEIFRTIQTGPPRPTQLPECGADHPPPSSAACKEYELYLYFPSVPA